MVHGGTFSAVEFEKPALDAGKRSKVVIKVGPVSIRAYCLSDGSFSRGVASALEVRRGEEGPAPSISICIQVLLAKCSDSAPGSSPTSTIGFIE